MKKFLSLALALLMAAVLLPTTALADDVITTSEQLKKAIENAQDGDTITLGEGNFTTYGNTTPNKSLTFVGAGERTVWTIGDLTTNAYGQANGDFSFEKCDTIKFKNMTLKSDSANYRGFAHTNHTVVENCILIGKTAYWGYNTATFTDCTFNAPESDYALWDYSSQKMTFDNCTFNVSGKVVNVYVEAGNGSTDARTVELKDCTVNSTIANKAVLNIKNNSQAYNIIISGTNTVTGLDNDADTNSNLYQVEAKGTNGKDLTVKIDGVTVWSDGAKQSDPPTPPTPPTDGPTVIITTPETPKTNDQKNPSTGANDMVAAAAALMAVAALGMSILSRKK